MDTSHVGITGHKLEGVAAGSAEGPDDQGFGEMHSRTRSTDRHYCPTAIDEDTVAGWHERQGGTSNRHSQRPMAAVGTSEHKPDAVDEEEALRTRLLLQDDELMEGAWKDTTLDEGYLTQFITPEGEEMEEYNRAVSRRQEELRVRQQEFLELQRIYQKPATKAFRNLKRFPEPGINGCAYDDMTEEEADEVYATQQRGNDSASGPRGLDSPVEGWGGNSTEGGRTPPTFSPLCSGKATKGRRGSGFVGRIRSKRGSVADYYDGGE